MRDLERDIGRLEIARLSARCENHQRAAGRIGEGAGERQQPGVDRRVRIDEDVAHQLITTPRSRSTSSTFAAASPASPSNIVA